MRRNRFYPDGETVARNTYSYPQGTYAPSDSQNAGTAYILPQRVGAMASFNDAAAAITTNALAVGGITTTGAASLLIQTNAPAGQLIAFGIGSASLLITPQNALLTASLNAIGAANFVLTGGSTNLTALGSSSGSAGLSMSVSATILPTNDASPLRTATASFAVTGALTPYAIGRMTGSTVDNTVLTSDLIAGAVWTKAIEAGFTAEQILRILAAHAAGAATGLEGANPQFTGLNGTTVRIDGAYSAGTRTIDALVGA